MTIYELKVIEKLSLRSYNICGYNKLDTLDKILEYYSENKTFEDLRNCGKKSNQELINLCKKYYERRFENAGVEANDSFRLNYLPIEHIYKNHEISDRSFQICLYNGIRNVRELLLYFTKNKSFLKLRNCGKGSDRELCDASLKYLILTGQDSELVVSNTVDFEKTISDLNEIQKTVINEFILIRSSLLSKRSKRRLSEYLTGDFTIENFSNKMLLSDEFDWGNLRRVGAKCVPELRIYILDIKDCLIEIGNYDNENQLLNLKNNFLFKRTLSHLQIPIEILENRSIFTVTDFLLESEKFFEDNHHAIIYKLKIFQHEKKSDESNSSVLSKERVRQLKKVMVQELCRKMIIIQNLHDDLFGKYGIDTAKDIIEITKKEVEKINTRNNTCFTQEFICFLLSVYLKSQFSLIGSVEEILIPNFSNSSNKCILNHCYLIRKEVRDRVDFSMLILDVKNRLSSRIKKSYSFNLKNYLLRFTIKPEAELPVPTWAIAKKILNEEFPNSLDSKDNLVFKKNSLKKVHEYAFEALELLGKPSTVKEITLKVLDLYPDYNATEDKIRTSMKKIIDFVPVGRQSIFGLKKWESEMDGFRGGTIRKIITEYLEEFDEPKHIFEIYEHTKSFRPNTYVRSIIDNLKADGSNKFIFFNQGFIGIKTKNDLYNRKKYNELPRQLGKKIISMHKKGYPILEIKDFLHKKYLLNYKESDYIMQNLGFSKEKFEQDKPRRKWIQGNLFEIKE